MPLPQVLGAVKRKMRMKLRANSSDCEPEGGTEARKRLLRRMCPVNQVNVCGHEGPNWEGQVLEAGMVNTKPWSCALDSAEELK